MSGPKGESRPIPLRVRRILQGGFIASSVDRVVQQDVPGHHGSPI